MLGVGDPLSQGAAPPTQQYIATLNGTPVAPSWSIDRGELGNIDVSTGKLTVAGTMGGKATVTAVYQGQRAATSFISPD